MCPPVLGFLGPAAGVIWAKLEKESDMSREAPGLKKSKTESKRVKIVEKQSILTLFSTPFSTFGAPGLRGPANSFSDSISNFGADHPCSRQKFSLPLCCKTCAVRPGFARELRAGRSKQFPRARKAK